MLCFSFVCLRSVSCVSNVAMSLDYPFLISPSGFSNFYLINHDSAENRKHNILVEEEFEDTKGVIRIRISKKNRQHNGQKIPKG